MDGDAAAVWDLAVSAVWPILGLWLIVFGKNKT
jgi:hypothetical protein